MRFCWVLWCLSGCASSAPIQKPWTSAELGEALERHLAQPSQVVVTAEPPEWAKTPGASGSLDSTIVGVGISRASPAELGRSSAELRARAAIVTRLESLSLEVEGLDVKLAAGVVWGSRTVAVWSDGKDLWAAKVVLDDSGKFLGALSNDPTLADWVAQNSDKLFARHRGCDEKEAR